MQVSCLLVALAANLAQKPVVVDDRLVLEMVAQQPQIVTPTGLTVDSRGRIWVLENHTHHRPLEYKGPPTDRLQVMSDFDSDGRATRIVTFADGLKDSMGLTLGKDGSAFVATRSAILKLRDLRGGLQANDRQTLVRLETKALYPHNGLAGFAWDPMGNLVFGLGENEGLPYKLIGTDGTTLTGGGEGGSIYRCRADGAGLQRIATGFWNPFHMAFDAFGHLFAVDNDPDSRGPCRLLHIIQGGDYGYRYRNGRKGLHPFTAWNGELPGTLPMVAGTAEAPSGIVAYEATNLPVDYRGKLLVTSWGDHVIECFTLADKGASFSASARSIVRGGEDFRPVAIAVGPDGALYFSDWVDKSYPVHGKGKVWRLRSKSPASVSQLSAAEQTKRERMQAVWAAAKLDPKDANKALLGHLQDDLPEARAEAARLVAGIQRQENYAEVQSKLETFAVHDSSPKVRLQALLGLRDSGRAANFVSLLANPDPFLRAAALELLGHAGFESDLLRHLWYPDPKLHVGILIALRRCNSSKGRAALPLFFNNSDPEVRRSAIQWVAEEGLREYSDRLQTIAARAPVTRDLFEALLAANDRLNGNVRKDRDEIAGEEFIAKILIDPKQPMAFRTLALRMLRPDHPSLNAGRLAEFVEGNEGQLQREAVKTLMLRSDEPAQKLLARLARDANRDLHLRQLAITGLAQSAASSREVRGQLIQLLREPALQRDVLRSLRDCTPSPEQEQEFWNCVDQASLESQKLELAEQCWLLARSAERPSLKNRLQSLKEIMGKRPTSPTEWEAALKGSGDALSGERVFFHARGPRCYACHRIEGHGGAIGPDLSTIGSSTKRAKLIESILQPSKEIAPQYTTWLLTTRDGRVRNGMIVQENADSTITVADSQGKVERIHRNLIEDRQAQKNSIMPENLHEQMTRRDFLDLIAYLESRK